MRKVLRIAPDLRDSKAQVCRTSTDTIFMMNFLLAFIVFIACFVVAVLAFFALLSCLGDEIRAAWTGRARNHTPTTYGLQYARVMGHSGTQGGWEQIELEDMLDKRLDDATED